MTEPTELELMMLVDDELPAARRAEVEAYLASPAGASARAAIRGLRAVSTLVAAEGRWPSADGEMADVVGDVMARLDAPPSAARSEGGRSEGGRSEGGRSEAGRSEGGRPRTAPAAAANDNGRLIFSLAIVAAAAAAILVWWGQGGAPDAPRVADPAPSLVPGDPIPAPPEPAERRAAMPPDGAEDPPGPAGADEAYGVEVAAVDFGGRSGAIYYVPAALDDAAGADAGVPGASVTTVVWLTDE